MDVLKRKCGAHNVIHGLRETCPQCVESARAVALASAGPKRAAVDDPKVRAAEYLGQFFGLDHLRMNFETGPWISGDELLREPQSEAPEWVCTSDPNELTLLPKFVLTEPEPEPRPPEQRTSSGAWLLKQLYAEGLGIDMSRPSEELGKEEP